MSIEIEVKMRLKDINELEGRLSAVGGKRCREMIEINTYLDTAGGTLRSSDQGLRVRVETPLNPELPPVATMTYKGPRANSEVKSRTELEVVVEPGASAIQLLEALGFRAVRRFEKHRRHWQVDVCVVDIDTLPYLGDFVEIEGPSEQAVLALRSQLGLDQLPLVQDSYIGMLEAYLLENQITAELIRLDMTPPS